MANFKQNDTWPPLRGSASDEDGLVDLTAADSLRVILKADATTISGTATVLEPPEAGLVAGQPAMFNWEYVWDADDLDTVGVYQVELEVTWDSASTPPKVETFPNEGYESLTVVDDLD